MWPLARMFAHHIFACGMLAVIDAYVIPAPACFRACLADSDGDHAAREAACGRRRWNASPNSFHAVITEAQRYLWHYLWYFTGLHNSTPDVVRQPR